MKKKKKKKVTTYVLEFKRINTFQTLHQGVNYQLILSVPLSIFQLWSLAIENNRKLLNDSVLGYCKKLQ